MKQALVYAFAVLMLAGGVGHIAMPDFYAPMIPDFISPTLAHVLATIAELGIGLALLLPQTRRWAALAFTGLMIAFLPLHIWDLVRPDPIMQSTLGAVIRLLIQFALIYGGYWIWKQNEKTNAA